MKDEKFRIGISKFYDKFFNNGEHVICYVNFENNKSMIIDTLSIPQLEIYLENGTYYKKPIRKIQEIKKFAEMVNDYDYIVLHSFFINDRWNLYLLLSGNYSKVIWIEWGYDLYNWSERQPHSIRERIVRRWQRKIREKCNTFVGIFPPDCDKYLELFPDSTARICYAPYCGATIPEEYKYYSADSRLEKTLEENDTVWIQIGHSAVETIDHFQALKLLEKFKDENIQLLIPLSYGNQKLADEVQSYAENVFGEKALCLRNFIPANEYFELLKRVDIAIFPTQRQIALGNIYRLVFRNAKLYLSENTVLFNYFQEKGVPIRAVEELKNCSFHDLISTCKSSQPDTFSCFISAFSDMDTKVDLWRKIYEGAILNNEFENNN